MGNFAKIGGCFLVMIVVLFGVIWLDQWSATGYPPQYPEGSLGAAAATACDPARPLAGRPESLAILCSDLNAQQSMATSTSKLFWISWLQVGIGILGTVAVLWSLRAAFDSIRMTQRTFELQSLAVRKEFKPDFAREPLRITAFAGGTRFRVNINFKNIGGSTAKNCQTAIVRTVVPLSPRSLGLNQDSLRFRDISRPIPKHGNIGFAFNLSRADTAALQAGTHGLQYAFMTIFEDDFGGRYVFLARQERWGMDLTESRTLREFEFTEPLLAGREH